MMLRPYHSSDVKALVSLFYETVHTVNANDYTAEQLDAWAPKHIDADTWDRRFLSTYTLVAERCGEIAGFGNIDANGYLDMLYVRNSHLNEGVATQICDALEASVSVRKVYLQASITARPFFEKRGYAVVKEQRVKRNGVILKNYVMEKVL